MSAGKKRLLPLLIVEGLIAPYHMLSHIHSNRSGIGKLITQICDHAVRITLRCLIVHFPEFLTDLLADSKPFLIGTDLCLLLCQLTHHSLCADAKAFLIFSSLMDLSLKIIRINIHTDDFGILRKLMNLSTNLTGTQGNSKAEQKVAFCIGDHICIPVSVSTSDAPEVQRIIKAQCGPGKYACDHRNVMGTRQICEHFFCFSGSSVTDHKYRPFCSPDLIQNIFCRLCSIRRIRLCNCIPVKGCPVFRIIFSIYSCLDLFLGKFHIINRIFHLASLHVHGKIDKNRSLSICIGDLPCKIQFTNDIFRITDLHRVLGYRLCHGNHIDLLKALLTKACNTGIFIGIQLSGDKDHRKRIEIRICHTRKQIGSSRTTGGIGTAAGILCLSITAGGKSSSLLMIAGMTSCMGILLNGIYQMCDHGSLVSKEIMDPFFLQKFHNIICKLDLRHIFLPSPYTRSFLFFPDT